MKTILIQQDDCAPDSIDYFDKEMLKETGMYSFEFIDKAKRTDMDDGMTLVWEFNNYSLEYSGDNPYYILYKLVDTVKTVEKCIHRRWEDGTEHHPKSVELFRALAKIDRELCGDYFQWKSGGDGDNGETFMYQLDIHFESKDLIPVEKINA